MESNLWIFAIIVTAALVLLLLGILRSLQTIEAMTRRLLALQVVESNDALEPSAAVKELAGSRRTYVAAIKTYREQTGLALREAKTIVDALVARGRGSR